jgi:trimethylamine--corrinoid protein Co-methyltransferase
MLDELHRDGPGGHFLDTRQTLKHFRDFWFPGLLDRKTREPWLAAGATTLGQRLNARVKDLVRDHQSAPLAPAIRSRLWQIVGAALS